MQRVWIDFIERYTDENNEPAEKEILDTVGDVYPNYKVNDILFLTIDVAPGKNPYNIKELRLDRYRITDVHHSVRQHHMDNDCTTNFRIEVYVRKL